ncbi:hypothetical protein [Cellulophaga sp. Hel_I_12]|uniref:hypothetical protein n=1 Tax=Cellulophaga sp. Hel_I_12 TaxID=1249972 RepID=UPI000648349F|nr:hypothetical protein [Cellulophaga sp. Hel_I_12]
MEYINQIIDWTNENSGFLSLVLFAATILFGWLSGLFNSLIKKPKLKVRFISKVCFYSTFYVDEKHEPKEGEIYDVHKTGFVIYASISNVGNMPTAIDKIYIGYKKNKKFSLFERRKFIWLAQWHSFTPFKTKMKNDSDLIYQSLRIKNFPTDNANDYLRIGESITGTAYFEQVKAWGNFSPLQNDDKSTDIKLKIIDVYGRKFIFDYKLEYLELEKARELNENFGNIEYLSS